MTAAFDRLRLAAILELLGSNQSGEVLNAAAAAERMRRSAGVSWYDLIAPLPATEQPAPSSAFTQSDLDVELVSKNAASCWLTEWEKEFVRSVMCRSYFSEKQAAVISNIAAKLRRNARAAA